MKSSYFNRIFQFRVFGYLVIYLGLIHLLTLSNIFLAGAQISTLGIDVFATYSLIITLVFVGQCLCSPDSRIGALTILVLVFLVYSLASILLYLQPSNPAHVTAFFYGFHLLVFPIFLYFTAINVKVDDEERLLRYLCYLHIMLVLIGLVLFVWRPEFYTDYLRERLASRNAREMWQLYARVNSYMGSSATGILSALTIAMLPMVKIRQFLKYIFLLLLLFVVLLTQQRGAYISASVATLFFLFYKNLNFKYLIIISVIFAAVVAGLMSSNESHVSFTVNYTINRISGDLINGDPLGERADSYAKGVHQWFRFPFGMGLGATTSAADTGGANPGGQVVDANYLRILCDLGLFGLIIFLSIVVVAAYTVLKNRKSKHYLIILFIYCFQAIGTNVFDVFYVNHLFWIYLAFIGSKSSAKPLTVTVPTQGRLTTSISIQGD